MALMRRVLLRKNRRVRGFTESLKEIGYQGIRRGDLVIHGIQRGTNRGVRSPASRLGARSRVCSCLTMSNHDPPFRAAMVRLSRSPANVRNCASRSPESYASVEQFRLTVHAA